MAPFGFVSDGITDAEEKFIDEDGNVWYTDGYGNPFSDVEYMLGF
jgi:hypothetical protein